MSHFSVLVVTDDKPTDDELERILAPYHEFECTGIDDEYVQDIDKTAEYRADYDKATASMIRCHDGSLVGAYDDRFYREPTAEEIKEIGPIAGSVGASTKYSYSSKDWGDGQGYRMKIHYIPEDCQQIEVPQREVQTFAEFIKDWAGHEVVPFGEKPDREDAHKYGYIELDAEGNVFRAVDRTNPEKKWDWWKVGGRWTGFLNLAYNPHTDPDNIETCDLCRGTGRRDDERAQVLREENPEFTCNGCDGTGHRLKWPTKWKKIGNQARKGDIDVAAFRDLEGESARVHYRKAHAIIAGRSIPSFEKVLAQHDGDAEAARKVFWGDPVIVALQGDKELRKWRSADYQQYAVSEEEYVERARMHTLCPFAFVKDGQWYENGKMGWWGIVTDEGDEDAWARGFASMLDNLPDNAWLTIVDAHI